MQAYIGAHPPLHKRVASSLFPGVTCTAQFGRDQYGKCRSAFRGEKERSRCASLVVTHTHTHTFTYTQTYVHTHTRTHIHTYIHTRTDTVRRIQTHIPHTHLVLTCVLVAELIYVTEAREREAQHQHSDEGMRTGDRAVKTAEGMAMTHRTNTHTSSPPNFNIRPNTHTPLSHIVLIPRRASGNEEGTRAGAVNYQLW